MNDTILLVDDNKMYANWMQSLFASYFIPFHYVESSIEALQEIKQKLTTYTIVVSDITMEHPGAGLTMCWKMRRLGFRGIIWIVSTGFDNRLVFWFSKLTLRFIGVSGIIRKKELREIGIWEVHWLQKTNNIPERLLSLSQRQSIPNWNKKR
ncbi:MAG: response regulator [bacterium]|nr:response regulator [bacterium]